MLEVDIDDSGTVDFFEFLCVARLISQGKGMYKAFSLEKKKNMPQLYLQASSERFTIVQFIVQPITNQ